MMSNVAREIIKGKSLCTRTHQYQKFWLNQCLNTLHELTLFMYYLYLFRVSLDKRSTSRLWTLREIHPKLGSARIAMSTSSLRNSAGLMKQMGEV